MSAQTLFAYLITLQFAVVALHDLVDVPGWTRGTQVRTVIGQRNLWLITLVNSVFPGLAAAFAVFPWKSPRPGLVADYRVLYCAVTVVSAIVMWYVPYLFGASEEQKGNFLRMYAGTRQVLPARGDNPRPNLLHVCFHVLFLATLALAMIMKFGSA